MMKIPSMIIFGVQLGLLEKKKTRLGPVRAALVQLALDMLKLSHYDHLTIGDRLC